MNNLVLIRQETSDQGTFGILLTGLGKWFYTLELPWKDNKSNISCIPKGTYNVKYTFSPKFKRNMYLVESVENRNGIRIHSANYAGNSEKGYKKHLYGCLALGLKKGILENQKAILLSRPAIRQFEKLMNNKDFILEIK